MFYCTYGTHVRRRRHICVWTSVCWYVCGSVCFVCAISSSRFWHYPFFFDYIFCVRIFFVCVYAGALLFADVNLIFSHLQIDSKRCKSMFVFIHVCLLCIIRIECVRKAVVDDRQSFSLFFFSTFGFSNMCIYVLLALGTRRIVYRICWVLMTQPRFIHILFRNWKFIYQPEPEPVWVGIFTNPACGKAQSVCRP